VQRTLRILAVLVLVVVAVPMALGAATGPVRDALGITAHKCACGMAPGKCGCAECARVEHARRQERMPGPAPIVRSSCDQDDAAPLASTMVPPFVLPLTGLAVPAPAHDEDPAADVQALHSAMTLEPPTPPPRFASV
jgi:hypothetical protein